jgi:hypothetical protein
MDTAASGLRQRAADERTGETRRGGGIHRCGGGAKIEREGGRAIGAGCLLSSSTPIKSLLLLSFSTSSLFLFLFSTCADV